MPHALTRRDFLRMAGIAAGSTSLAGLLEACSDNATATLPPVTTQAATTTAGTLSVSPTPKAGGLMQFPKGFSWGVGTSAYQIEGAVKEDGRGVSIWDYFSHTPGKVKAGDTGDVADDHYHLYEQDLDLMKDLGFQSYRFSIAWPRVVPDGSGAVNQKGLDFYKRLVDGLLKRGITPMATLYHWDLPQVLQDKGGWANRDTAQYFASYTETVFKALADQVPAWATINEPWVIAYVGNAFGAHAPGLQSYPTALKVTHTLNLAHGLAVQSFRALNPKNSQVGIVLDFNPAYSLSDKAEDKAATLRFDGYRHRWFLDPVFKGKYPEDMYSYFDKKYGPLDYIKPDDAKIYGQKIDLLGINYYSPARIASNPRSGYFELDQKNGNGPTTAMGWEIYPDALYDLLTRIKTDYGDIPLYVTENGAAFDDSLDSNGQVNDEKRVDFLRGHFKAAQKAITAGVNLKGYFVWSFMDNFEWAEGYGKRFGIVYVDYKTQKRTPKRSALWYRDVIKQNGIEENI